jgi:hypothetical protein
MIKYRRLRIKIKFSFAQIAFLLPFTINFFEHFSYSFYFIFIISRRNSGLRSILGAYIDVLGLDF